MKIAEIVSTFVIGGDLKVNRLGYGCMQLTGEGVWGDVSDRAKAKAVLKGAVEAGVNFFDTADSYGPHTNEVLVQEALGDSYGKRKGGGQFELLQCSAV